MCILFGVYALLFLTLKNTYIQSQVGKLVANQLSEILHSEVKIGKVELRLLNRIVISDFTLKDQKKNKMLHVARLSSKFELIPLLTEGRIVINNIQLSSFKANLYRENSNSKPNYQFLLDNFASKDSTSSSINLRINSIILRRGQFVYDVRTAMHTPGIWNSKHLKVDSIYAKLALKALHSDSINVQIKHVRLHEQSGFMLKKLSMKLVSNRHTSKLTNVNLYLPNSRLELSQMEAKTNEMLSFFSNNSTLEFKGRLNKSYIHLKDIACFNEALRKSNKNVNISMAFKGNKRNITLSPITFHSPDYFSYNGRISLNHYHNIEDLQLETQVIQGKITQAGIHKINEILTVYNKQLPAPLLRLGDIFIHGKSFGNLKKLETQLKINTSVGNLDLNIRTSLFRKHLKASGKIKYEDLNLGSILNKTNLFGKTTGTLLFKLQKRPKKTIEIDLQSDITSFKLKEYDYQNIKINASYSKNKMSSILKVYDVNGIVNINANFERIKKIPYIGLTAQLYKVNLHALNLISSHKKTNLSTTLRANLKHLNLEKVTGEIVLDSLLFKSPNSNYTLNKFHIVSTDKKGEKKINIKSDFLTAEVKGNYRLIGNLYYDLLKKIKPHIPILLESKNLDFNQKEKKITLKARIKSSALLQKIFNIPIWLQQPIDINGKMNNSTQLFELTAHIPKIRYKKDTYCNGLLICENKKNKLSGLLRITTINDNKHIRNITLNANLHSNLLKTEFSWANADSKISNYGNIEAHTTFLSNQNFLKAKIDIKPTHIVLNDSSWILGSMSVHLDSGHVDLNNFIFKHEKRHIKAYGRLGSTPQDTLHTELKGMGLGYLFNLVGVNLNFDGSVSGKAYIAHAFKKPQLLAKMNIKNYTFNDSVVGDLNITGTWNHKRNGLHLNGVIHEKNAKTECNGYVFIQDKKLDLKFKARNTNVSFLSKEIESTVQNFSGRASGHARLYGGFSSLNLVGKLYADAHFNVGMVNIPMFIKDTITFKTNGVFFHQNKVTDNYGHTGTLNGGITYTHFKHSKFDLLLNSNGMLIYDIPKKSRSVVYGKIFASGETKIKGEGNEIRIEAKLNPDENSHFAYVTSPSESALSNQFITFVDKTRYWEENKSSTKSKKKEEDSKELYLTLMATVTPNLALDIIMNPVTGDYIRTRGHGDFRVQFYNKGKFMMNGDFLIDQGDYHFSMQQIIRKTFSLKSGSSIHFEDDAQNALLNLKTFYTVNSASLSDLGITENISQNSVKVNCLMDITGTLKTPNFSFDIEIPNVSEEERELVRSTISTEEEMNMQIIYLLGVGKFYAQNYVNNGQQSSNTMTSVLSSTLSGQLNSFLSQVINSKKWNFGTNLSTGQKGWTDVEVEGLFSGQLLNNRLLINGNLGYKENPMTKSNFVGDFSAEWLLTKKGELRLKAYNQTNDRYFGRNTLTTQGLGIMFKKDFTGWRDFFQIFGNKRRK